jgi:hypothetical protein
MPERLYADPEVRGRCCYCHWIPVAEQLPPNSVLVDTKIDDADGVRNEQPLTRQGRLWFFSDGSMYVYYEPTHWRMREE